MFSGGKILWLGECVRETVEIWWPSMNDYITVLLRGGGGFLWQ